jgi:hypothetical protein
MAVANHRIVPKNFRLDPAQIARAKKALAAKTETETIVRALDYVITEAGRNRATAEANKRFLKSGIRIHDVFGSLAE